MLSTHFLGYPLFGFYSYGAHELCVPQGKEQRGALTGQHFLWWPHAVWAGFLCLNTSRGTRKNPVGLDSGPNAAAAPALSGSPPHRLVLNIDRENVCESSERSLTGCSGWNVAMWTCLLSLLPNCVSFPSDHVVNRRWFLLQGREELCHHSHLTIRSKM